MGRGAERSGFQPSLFMAYAEGAYLFNALLAVDQDPLNWWEAYRGTPNGGILAVGSSS
jgi:hypothetical protein